SGETGLGEVLSELAADQGAADAVGMDRGHRRDGDAADLPRPAEAHELRLGLVAAERLQLAGEEAGHLAAGDDPRILRHGDLDGAGVGRGRDAGIRAPALARVHRGDAPVAHMVAVDVADENGVDLAEALVVRTRDRAADVVENARAVR